MREMCWVSVVAVGKRTEAALAVAAIEDNACCQVHANIVHGLLMPVTLPRNAGGMPADLKD